jgi:hypothetical protein
MVRAQALDMLSDQDTVQQYSTKRYIPGRRQPLLRPGLAITLY